MKITSEYLLEGAALAIEQSSTLIESAVRLYESGSFSTALVLAAFAREEMGKSAYYTEIERKLSLGENAEVTLAKLKKETASHLFKQQKATLSISVRGKHGTTLGDALRTTMNNELNTEAYKYARKIVDDAIAAKAKRVADDRVKQREIALYVDPIENGWSSPENVPKDDVRDFMYDAVNDYSVFRQNMQYHISSPLDQYIKANSTKFDLASPRWPSS